VITKLTKPQEKLLVDYRNEILAFGRSTLPSDRAVTEKAISFFYSKLGKKAPKFFWFDGPFSGILGIEILKGKDSNLGSNLGLNLGSNLWSNLRLNLGSNLRLNLESNFEIYIDNMFWGQHELAWVAFYDFCNKIGVKYKTEDRKLLDAWLSIGKSTGWWTPYENICFCFERPSSLNLDKDGKLHSANGTPAMGFRDGYRLYFWHGEQIPKEVVNWDEDDDDLTVKTKIDTWRAFSSDKKNKLKNAN